MSTAKSDENQLTSVWVANTWSNSFVYDGLLRKRIERDYSWNGSVWQETNEVHFIYDGYVVIQERNGNNLPQVTYTRGMDLAGSESPLLGQTVDGFQGAGGIGGLLARTDMGLWVAKEPNASAYYFSDAQGNVVAMMNTNLQMVAQYEYDPSGNMLSLSGPLAGANRYRFSSKEWNDAAGLYYYGFRFYDPNLQRWLNRDPIQEQGGINLFGFLLNTAVNFFDPLGLCDGVPNLLGSTGNAADDFANSLENQEFNQNLQQIVNNFDPFQNQANSSTGGSGGSNDNSDQSENLTGQNQLQKANNNSLLSNFTSTPVGSFAQSAYNAYQNATNIHPTPNSNLQISLKHLTSNPLIGVSLSVTNGTGDVFQGSFQEQGGTYKVQVQCSF